PLSRSYATPIVPHFMANTWRNPPTALAPGVDVRDGRGRRPGLLCQGALAGRYTGRPPRPVGLVRAVKPVIACYGAAEIGPLGVGRCAAIAVAALEIGRVAGGAFSPAFKDEPASGERQATQDEDGVAD